jgi:micrococcal nuclease
MSRRRRVVALLCTGLGAAVLTAVVLPLGGPAAATTVSSGGSAVVQYGTVEFVADGDTIDVLIDGVSPDPGREGTRIRFLATQATELYSYHHDLNMVTGECHAIEAAKRLKALLYTASGKGRRVRLTARDASSSNLGRESRFVATKGSDGGWHDVGTVLVREGQVIPSYQKTEYSHNASYRKLSEAAAAAGRGIWDTSYCGPGPAAHLSVRVHWDTAGDDAKNVDDEYVKITNRGTATVKLGNWWVRDSATRKSSTPARTRRGFIFPVGAQVRPGASVFVHVGKAPSSPTAGHFYYGLSAPIFENVTPAPVSLGDGGYLFDPQGDLRGWQQYPCVSAATSACTG